jgi:hypothetical protein
LRGIVHAYSHLLARVFLPEPVVFVFVFVFYYIVYYFFLFFLKVRVWEVILIRMGGVMSAGAVAFSRDPPKQVCDRGREKHCSRAPS